jgi:hypothetical protein
LTASTIEFTCAKPMNDRPDHHLPTELRAFDHHGNLKTLFCNGARSNSTSYKSIPRIPTAHATTSDETPFKSTCKARRSFLDHDRVVATFCEPSSPLSNLSMALVSSRACACAASRCRTSSCSCISICTHPQHAPQPQHCLPARSQGSGQDHVPNLNAHTGPARSMGMLSRFFQRPQEERALSFIGAA